MMRIFEESLGGCTCSFLFNLENYYFFLDVNEFEAFNFDCD
jgi:hypothetical protein